MRKTIVLLLSLAASTVASGATLTETVDKTFDVGSAAVLSLQNENGRVTVNAWDQPRIRVIAEKTVSRTDRAEAQRVMAELRVDIEAHGNQVTVRTGPVKDHAGFWDMIFGNWNDASVRYEVSVPKSMARLSVDDSNGAIEISGVSAAMKIETTNGHIALTRCGGSVDASSSNGRITAELMSVDPRGANTLETTNGRIEVSLPPSVHAELDAETTNGHVDSELPIATRNVGRAELRGTINGGGPTIRLRTTNGSIHILSVK